MSQTSSQREAKKSALAAFLAHSSKLNNEALHSFETPANFRWTIQHYIPEYSS
jgi:hypothetical protein